LPNFSLPGDVSASSRYWSEDIIEPPVTVSTSGEIDVPWHKAGRGYELDRQRVEAETVRRLRLQG
jgi:O-succinylbenzoate synthase